MFQIFFSSVFLMLNVKRTFQQIYQRIKRRINKQQSIKRQSNTKIVICLKLNQMITPNNNLGEERYHTYTFSNSSEESQIETLLKGQKYHQRLSLSLSLIRKHKITFIGNCISNLNHLKGLHIIFTNISQNEDCSIEEILKPLKSFHNLTDFKFEIHQTPHSNSNCKEITLQLASFLKSLSQLERLSITIPNIFQSNDKHGKEQFITAFENMKSLKELRWTIIISESQSEFCLNEFLDTANQLNSLIFNINGQNRITDLWRNNKILWQFDNLNILQELQIKSRFCELSLKRFNEQLKYLQSLIKLSIDLISSDQCQINQFFNTSLNLKNLEELKFTLSSDNAIFSSISIGEIVCLESQLKTLVFVINKTQKQGFGSIVFQKNITNIKLLERFNLNLNHYQISSDSFQILSTWKNEWTRLRDFAYSNIYNRSKEGFHNNNKMIEFLKECFQSTKSITKIRISLTFFQQQCLNSFLSGLALLTNLKIFSCSFKFRDTVNFNSQNLLCFQNLSQLTELRFNNIQTKQQILFLGESFKFMSALVILHIEFEEIYDNLNQFDVFCKSLQYLQNLKQFYFSFNIMLENDKYLMNSQDTHKLLQGILHLKCIEILGLYPKIQVLSSQVFKTGLSNIIDQFHQLRILNILQKEVAQNKNNILRHSLRLVKFNQ